VTDDKVICCDRVCFASASVTRPQVIVWNYPDVLFVDRDMIEATTTGELRLCAAAVYPPVHRNLNPVFFSVRV
jgi:hypothetical protein